ncbi:MAG: IS110 family transposase [Salinivirgaceae bacterium]|jgi:transposase|nr:IS110 family transposase [Salinivirgaceae bacterium]
MRSKGNKLSFKGQKIYVGIDHHLKRWSVTVYTEELMHKKFSMDPNPKQLANYLNRNFPEAEYLSAYEAGFSGFSTHRKLLEVGIKNIVVNPADIPTTDKERKQKEDKRDSNKIAKSLRSQSLVSIYVPSRQLEELRGLMRYRKTLVKDISRNKTRIKMFLYRNGVDIPDELGTASKYWSSAFTKWLKTVRLTTAYGHIELENLLENTEKMRLSLLYVTKEIRKLSCHTEWKSKVDLLITIPGVGVITAMTFLSELYTIKRFKNLDHLCSYIGLVPTTNSSGDSERTGNITRRRNNHLRTILTESAWIAARTDPALTLKYNELKKRMNGNKAIIRIAKKLLNRIRFVLLNEVEYQYAIK